MPCPALWVLGLAMLCSSAQGQSGSAPAEAGAQTQADPAAKTPAPKGKVLFERHEAEPVPDAVPAEAAPAVETAPTGVSSSSKRVRGLRRRGATAATAEPPAGDAVAVQEPAGVAWSSSAATVDADGAAPVVVTAADRTAAARISQEQRRAVRVTATNLDIHLNSHTGAVEGRAQVTVRNEGDAALAVVPLRVSGALKWESARLASSQGGTVLPMEQYRLADDLDHTGAASEIALRVPLAPGATVQLDLYYGGVLTESAQRLMAMGAPAGRAALTDWDAVSDAFTGLRGLGDVLWYPVTEPPALLSDGAAVTAAVESSRARDAANAFKLRLTVEYTGSRPDAAFFCGERRALKPLGRETDLANTPEGGVVTAEWDRTALGPHTPSLFVANGAPQEAVGGLLRVVTDHADTVAALGEAAAKVRPMMTEWLGASPVQPLDVLDLPVPGAAGFTDGGLLVAPLSTSPATVLAPRLIQPMTGVWMPANVQAAWLRDGFPAFMQAVWAERTEGRGAALNGLAAQANALKAQEAPRPAAANAGFSSSSSADDVAAAKEALAVCGDPACARGKAAYVLEMLRGILGDAAMQQTLSGWRVAVESMPRRTAADETAAFERLLQQTAGKRDLSWFFGDWIDADKGLPELSIVTVAPRKVERVAPTNYLPPKEVYGGPLGAEPVPKPGDPESTAPRSTSPNDRSIAPGSWMVAVEVQNTGAADAEVPVTVRAGGLVNTLPLKVPAHGRATVRIPFEAEPEEVEVNDGSVPEQIALKHRRSLHGLSR